MCHHVVLAMGRAAAGEDSTLAILAAMNRPNMPMVFPSRTIWMPDGIPLKSVTHRMMRY
ncbi:hypothetical protein ACNKHO_19505 [Shigella flexneri]